MTSTDVETDAPSEGELVSTRFRVRAQTNGREPRREHRSEILANPATLVRTTSHLLNLSFAYHSPVIHLAFTLANRALVAQLLSLAAHARGSNATRDFHLT